MHKKSPPLGELLIITPKNVNTESYKGLLPKNLNIRPLVMVG